jgi:hypothetical protein
MSSIFSKIFTFSNIIIPELVRNSFTEKFGDSINIEWLQSDDFYEAIFYHDEIEHIAYFESTGKLLNLKKNRSIYNIPQAIKDKASEHGELMNVIEISEKEIVGYELIIRDESLIRFSLLLNEKGGLINKRKL